MTEGLRAWARTYTDRGRYTPVGILFHWVMALLVLFQLGWGWYMAFPMPGGDKLHAYEIHSAAGLPILILALLRIGWRLLIPGPINDADRLGWQTLAAHLTHYLFYFSFFGLPLSGWAMWSSVAEPGPLYLAGFLPWPQLPLNELPLTMRWTILDLAEDVHLTLVVLLAVLVPAHVGAALKHHFSDRHDVLRAILPEVPDAEDAPEGQLHKPKPPGLREESGAG